MAHAKVLTATGLRFVLYDLRHTFATRMAEAGCPLATLAAILGHANLRSISKYVHPNEKDQHLAMDLYFRPVETVRFWSGLPPKTREKQGLSGKRREELTISNNSYLVGGAGGNRTPE